MKNLSLQISCIFITVAILICVCFASDSYGLDPLICHEGTIANSGRWTDYQKEKPKIEKLLKSMGKSVNRTTLAEKYIELHTKPIPGYGNINKNLDGNLWKIPPKGAIVKLNNGKHTVVMKDNYGRAFEMMNRAKTESKRLSESSLFDIANRMRPEKTGDAREPFKKKPVEVFEWKDKVPLDKDAISLDPKVRRQWFDKEFGVKPTSEYKKYEQIDSKIYKNGYDTWGYDREGHNKQGFNMSGIHKDTGTRYDVQGYDENGYDKRGFDKAGVNKFTKTKYDAHGYDRGGYDARGFSKSGIHKDTGTKYDGQGFDETGYDKDRFNRKGWDKAGYDRDGYNVNGFDRDGFDRDGFGRDGFNLYGLDKEGYNRQGYNISGFDREGFNRDGFNLYGLDREGYDSQGYNINGFNREGFNRDGFNLYGLDKEGYDSSGYDINGFNREGFGRDGFNLSGFDRDGYDRDGYDLNGYNREGYDKNGNSRVQQNGEENRENLSKTEKCYSDIDCPEGYVCVNNDCVLPMDDTYKNFVDKKVKGEIDRKTSYQDQQWIDQSLMAERDSKTDLSERVREIFEKIRKHTDGTDDKPTSPPRSKTTKPPKFKCKSNQDCWTKYKSDQYYCDKGKGKCIKCPDNMHGKKDGSPECCSDEPSSGTGGKKSVPDKFPKRYGGTIVVTLPGCSSNQPITVSLEDHTVGPENLAIYKYNLVANYGFSIKYDKEKGTGSVEAKESTPHYGYHYSDGRISIMPLGLKGNYTDTKLDGTGGYKKSGVYGNYSVKYQVSLTRQN